MNIIISGYGKMGKELEKKLKNHNLYIVSRETNLTFNDIKDEIDVIIDFSYPDQIYEISKYLLINPYTNLIIGTTSYNEEQLELIKNIGKTHKVIMFSNFSKGCNILFKLVEVLSSYLSDEQIYLLEKHHKDKKDSPSGTSKTIIESLNKKLEVTSIRSGKIRGEHQLDIYFNNEMISLKHIAYSREAFVERMNHILELLETLDVGLYTKENLDIWKEMK